MAQLSHIYIRTTELSLILALISFFRSKLGSRKVRARNLAPKTLMGLGVKNFIASLIILGFPVLVHAGIFSFVTSIFAHASDIPSGPSSQTIALLEAPLNINPSSSFDAEDITIVENSALLSNNDPVGGISENLKNTPSSDQISIYVVRSEDTLAGIAKMFGVTVNTIRWNNDISGSTISPGQTLTILPITGIRHVVKKGDTVASITKLYSGDLDEVEKYNDLTKNSKLSVDDVVIVPSGEIAKAKVSTVSTKIKFSSTSSVTSGYFIRPTTGPKTQGIHGHNGVDIAPSYGAPVVAAAEGKVIISKASGWNGGYGIYVVISHPNGTQTLYSHLSKNTVEADSYVEQGEIIGKVGNSGKVTGVHLHFEVRGAKNPF